MKVRSVQPTPNPYAFKFVLDGRVIDSGVKNYTKPTEAQGDPLAARLFAIKDVDTVFFCDDFVTISMLQTADWRAVHDEVVKVLGAHQGRPTAARGAAPAATATATPAPAAATAAAATATAASAAPSASDADLLRRIDELLDDRVRPALAGDGGGLELLSLEGKTLRIRYQGACGSCPSSIAGTLSAIENLLHTEIDAELEVVSA